MFEHYVNHFLTLFLNNIVFTWFEKEKEKEKEMYFCKENNHQLT